MKLITFVMREGKIGINPYRVVTIRPSGTDKTVIFLATGGQITVDGTFEEVEAKLNDEPPST